MEDRDEQRKNGLSLSEEQQLYWNNEEKQEIKREVHYMITPSKLDVKELYNYFVVPKVMDK